jgi:hypothetical protein
MVTRGWVYTSSGRLQKGNVSRPANGFEGPSRAPWDADYNPSRDAPAALLGATMISPRRYRLGAWLLDENGAHRDEEAECPGCGCIAGDVYRMVLTDNTFSRPRWAQRFYPCPRCVTGIQEDK